MLVLLTVKYVPVLALTVMDQLAQKRLSLCCDQNADVPAPLKRLNNATGLGAPQSMISINVPGFMYFVAPWTHGRTCDTPRPRIRGKVAPRQENSRRVRVRFRHHQRGATGAAAHILIEAGLDKRAKPVSDDDRRVVGRGVPAEGAILHKQRLSLRVNAAGNTSYARELLKDTAVHVGRAIVLDRPRVHRQPIVHTVQHEAFEPQHAPGLHLEEGCGQAHLQCHGTGGSRDDGELGAGRDAVAGRAEAEDPTHGDDDDGLARRARHGGDEAADLVLQGHAVHHPQRVR